MTAGNACVRCDRHWTDCLCYRERWRQSREYDLGHREGHVAGYDAAVRVFWAGVCERHVDKERQRAAAYLIQASGSQACAAAHWSGARLWTDRPEEHASRLRAATRAYADARRFYRLACEAAHAAKMLPTWAREGCP